VTSFAELLFSATNIQGQIPESKVAAARRASQKLSCWCERASLWIISRETPLPHSLVRRARNAKKTQKGWVT